MFFRKDGDICNATLVQRLGNKPMPKKQAMKTVDVFAAIVVVVGIVAMLAVGYVLITKTMDHNNKSVAEFSQTQQQQANEEAEFQIFLGKK